LADAIGSDVANVVGMKPQISPALVVDLFAGSGNTLYWLTRHLSGANGLGFELDAGVFRLTHQNLAIVGLPIQILNVDYRSGLRHVAAAADQLLIAFIAPPWGDALERIAGLDLRRTNPPIIDIVTLLFKLFPHNRLLCAIQTFELLNAASLEELRTCFDWSASRTCSQEIAEFVVSAQHTARPGIEDGRDERTFEDRVLGIKSDKAFDIACFGALMPLPMNARARGKKGFHIALRCPTTEPP
jgi:16S rRNA G966 N2-methylase RsmD